jgi:hypothetical protein
VPPGARRAAAAMNGTQLEHEDPGIERSNLGSS